MTYVPTRPLPVDRQTTTTATKKGTTATATHAFHTFTILLQIVFSGKRTTCRCDTGKNSHWFLPWILPTTTTFAWHNKYFSPCFLCRNVIPCFLVHPPHAINQTKRCMCNSASVCVCSYSYLHYLNENKTTSMRPNACNTALEAGDAATPNAAEWLFLAQ